MARSNELPPVPSHPELSPPATVPGEEDVRVPGLDGGPSLEAKLHVPKNPTRAVLLCHPHPLYGGSMHSAVILAIAKILREKGGENGPSAESVADSVDQGSAHAQVVAHLRFNYRGVGTSEGAYGEGRGETEDARAALRLLRERAPNVPVTVCGYSFGTFVGLRAAVIENGIENGIAKGAANAVEKSLAGGDPSDAKPAVDRVVLVAPAVRVFSFLRDDGQDMRGKIFITVGDNDEFCDVSEAEELARMLDARLTVFPKADHYFIGTRRKLAESVYPEIVPS